MVIQNHCTKQKENFGYLRQTFFKNPVSATEMGTAKARTVRSQVLSTANRLKCAELTNYYNVTTVLPRPVATLLAGKVDLG